MTIIAFNWRRAPGKSLGGDGIKPGRELDALVAEKVFTLRVERRDHWGDGDAFFFASWDDNDGEPDEFVKKIPHYSTNIAAAWEVVEKISCNSFQISWEDDFGWKVQFNFWDSGSHSFKEYVATGNTAPHAICLAALAAVGEKK